MKTLDLFHGWQHDLVRTCQEKPRFGLFPDMGSGKTVISLTAMVNLLNEFEISKLLVIAPKRAAEVQWPQEISEWEHLKDIGYRSIKGTAQQRVKALSGSENIHIISKDNLKWLILHYKEQWSYDAIIIDESSFFKNWSAQKTKWLRKVLYLVDRVLILSGTPCANGLMDLYSQIYLLDRGERLGKNITAFRTQYFYYDENAQKWIPKSHAKEQIFKKLSDICSSLETQHLFGLEPVRNNFVYLELPSKLRKIYERLKKEFRIQLENTDLTVEFSAAKNNKMLQFLNGAVYTGENREFEQFHELKLDALEEVIEGIGGKNLLIGYQYKFDLEMIKKRFPDAVSIKEKDAIQRWNKGEIKLLCAHPASAGHALNLQAGGHHAVWYGSTWNLEHYQQLNKRLHRPGQKHQVVLHHLMFLDTIEETVYKTLERKNLTQAELLESVKLEILS